MEEKCMVCHKSIRELADENPRATKISLESELFTPYNVCEECESFLHHAICAVLEDLGLVEFDEKTDTFIRTK